MSPKTCRSGRADKLLFCTRGLNTRNLLPRGTSCYAVILRFNLLHHHDYCVKMSCNVMSHVLLLWCCTCWWVCTPDLFCGSWDARYPWSEQVQLWLTKRPVTSRHIIILLYDTLYCGIISSILFVLVRMIWHVYYIMPCVI